MNTPLAQKALKTVSVTYFQLNFYLVNMDEIENLLSKVDKRMTKDLLINK